MRSRAALRTGAAVRTCTALGTGAVAAAAFGRRMVRATIANAWRSTVGRASPVRRGAASGWLSSFRIRVVSATTARKNAAGECEMGGQQSSERTEASGSKHGEVPTLQSQASCLQGMNRDGEGGALELRKH